MAKEKQDKLASLRLTIRVATANDEARVVALWRASNLVTSYNDPSKDFHFARAKEGSDILVGLTRNIRSPAASWSAMTDIAAGYTTLPPIRSTATKALAVQWSR